MPFRNFDAENPLQIGLLVGLVKGDIVDAVIVFWCLQQLTKSSAQVPSLFIVATIASLVKIASWSFY